MFASWILSSTQSADLSSIVGSENGIKYDVEEGMLLVLEPGKVHRGYRPTETETEVYWIHFQYPQPSQPMLAEKINWQQPLLKRTDQDTESHPAMIDIPKFAAIDLRTVVPLMTEMLNLHRVLTQYRSFELHILLGQLLIQLQTGMRKRVRKPDPIFLAKKWLPTWRTAWSFPSTLDRWSATCTIISII